MIASVRRTLVALCTTVALCAAAALAPVAAQADSGCPASATGQPFATWGDYSSYALAPGGDFEGGPAWTLSGGAAVVNGSETFAATGTPGSYSLSLPAGSSAQSPPTCVSANDPTLRFFIAGSGKVMVRVAYGGPAIPVGLLDARGSWAPSAILPTGSALFSTLWGGSTDMTLTFTALTGNPQIDDVFIDPWNRH